jgi:hypothetical protein
LNIYYCKDKEVKNSGENKQKEVIQRQRHKSRSRQQRRRKVGVPDCEIFDRDTGLESPTNPLNNKRIDYR